MQTYSPGMEKTPTRKIEFLLAYDDETWSTEIVDVPEEMDPVEWANEKLAPLSRYRKVVLFAVYSEVPDEGED